MMMSTFYSKQRGLSLIELMVAMALSLILMAGVLQIFISNKKSFEITRDLSDVQENGRLGITFIGESIRNADHWGAVEGGLLSNSAAVTDGNGSCNSAWILNSEVAIEGFEETTGAGAPVDCINNPDENYFDGTDVLVVRYADGRAMVPEDDVGDLSSTAANDVYVRVLTAQEGRVFNGSAVSGAVSAIPSDTAVLTFPYMTELYYVRRCSILGADSKCDADIDDTPTLVRMTLSGNTFTEQPLVEGVEQLQFEYGVDTIATDSDTIVDTFLNAGDTQLDEDGEWSNVLSVRMSLVARASQLDIQVNDTATYALAGGREHEASDDASTPNVSKYRRKQYNREINLRNRSRL